MCNSHHAWTCHYKTLCCSWFHKAAHCSRRCILLWRLTAGCLQPSPHVSIPLASLLPLAPHICTPNQGQSWRRLEEEGVESNLGFMTEEMPCEFLIFSYTSTQVLIESLEKYLTWDLWKYGYHLKGKRLQMSLNILRNMKGIPRSISSLTFVLFCTLQSKNI